MLKCPENRACFAQDAIGNCEILSDTTFNRACPFYKPPRVIDDDAEFTIPSYEGTFKKIKGYNYVISTNGVVLNKLRKPIKPIFDKSKTEWTVNLSHNNKMRHFRIAALVAGAFLPGTGRVFYKNGDRNDYRLENLERR